MIESVQDKIDLLLQLESLSSDNEGAYVERWLPLEIAMLRAEGLVERSSLDLTDAGRELVSR